MHQKSQLKFTWQIAVAGFAGTAVSDCRCDNACDLKNNGIPLPLLWRTALPAVVLSQKAAAAASKVQLHFGVADLSCVFLGQPRPTASPSTGAVNTVGGIVTLTGAPGEDCEYLLLAHVTADVWVCHKGRDPLFDTEDPFDVGLLEVQDFRGAVVATATATSRRRTGKTSPVTPLIDAARMRPTSWSSAVAYAFWKAEEERSKSTNLPFRLEVAAQGFERNPFEWTAEADGWVSRSKVVFAWEWFKDGCWYRELTYVMCHHVLSGGRDVPPPLELCDVSAFWWQELEKAAAKVEFLRCTYLGRDMGGGRFEKDPAKWPPCSSDRGDMKV